jgi:hypothetical protein
MAKVIDRVFVYDDQVVAIALPPDFGVVLDIPESAPTEVLAAVAAASQQSVENKDASAANGARTQHGSDGLGLLIGYMIRHLSGRRRSASITSSFAG